MAEIAKSYEIKIKAGLGSVAIRVGKLIWDFISNNYKSTVAGTVAIVTVDQITTAINQSNESEIEKARIIQDVAASNPELAKSMANKIFGADSGLILQISNLIIVAGAVIVAYMLLKKK